MFVSEIYDECAEILGTTDEKKVYRKIQQAVQSLLESGHWTHATAEIDVCTGWDKCSIALPRGVDIPLAVNIDGSPTYFRNRLFQYHINKGGVYNPVEWAWDDRGYVSTLMDILRPSQLIAIAEHNNDAGKTIRVLGLNQNNHPLTSQLPNGTIVDGIIVPIHSQQDFAYGTIIPDDATINTRICSISPISLFKTASPHGLSSGQGMLFRVLTGNSPSPIKDGQIYYVGVVDEYTLSIYNDSLNAIDGNYPISIQSIVGVGQIQLQDKRNSQVVTTLKFSSVPSIAIDSPNEVIFPSGQTLPAPLEAKKTYFANPIDSQNLNIFSSLSDAKNNTNPIYTAGSMSEIDIDVRKEIVPETKLTFAVKHYFNDGDQVQAYTSGGTLPQPLISGQNYYVNVINDYSVSLHENQADANSSTATNFVNPIKITTAGVGTNSLVKLIQATATSGKVSQITAPGLNIGTPSGSGASFQAIVVGSITSVRVVSQGTGYDSDPTVTFSDPTGISFDSPLNGQQKTAKGYAVRDTVNNKIINIVITDAGFGYLSSPAPTITISPPNSGSQATATATVTTSLVSGFTKISGGSGYNEAPQVKIEGGSGSGATATANISSGSVTSLNLITSGSNYTSTPTTTITPSTGVFVNFSSTGSLPSPLVSGTAYRAEPPLDEVNRTFTVKNTDYSDVNITSGSTGTFYVVLSRAFGVDFTNNWLGDFTGVSTGQKIYFGTDYTLPATSPAIDNGVTPFYLNVLSTSLSKIYSNESLTTIIDVNSFGNGQSYYQIRLKASPSTSQNLIKPENLGYLTDSEVVQFSTSGLLPSPIAASTNYTIKIVGDAIQIYSGGVLVPITSTGSGQLTLNIIRDLTISPSTKIKCDTSIFETGGTITARPSDGDSLPQGLSEGEMYYIRRSDNNSFELYDTLANAQNLSSTNGIIEYYTSGNSVNSKFFIDEISEPIFVKSVSHIDKPITDGYVSLYAWDYYRSNDMTLIGQYHPTETNPSYRKIRIGKPCAWARIIYKVTSPKITSQYDFIPLEQERAIIAAVHAVDLEDKDFADQAARYWQLAFAYLKNQQDSIDGHAMAVPQINNITYANADDPVMW